MCDKDLFTNGRCDDETNNEECFFDFGDCCKFQIFVGECTNCICHEDKTRHTFWVYPNEIKIRDFQFEKSILVSKLYEASGLGTTFIQ